MIGIPKGIFLVVVIASLVALLVGSALDTGGVQMVFAHKSISVQTEINKDKLCERAGRTLGITNFCTATPDATTVSTSVTLGLGTCTSSTSCNVSTCNNLGCTSINCVQINTGFHTSMNCLTNNGVQLTSCNPPPSSGNTLSCTRGGGAVNVKPVVLRF
jgi:hypothetical protein